MAHLPLNPKTHHPCGCARWDDSPKCPECYPEVPNPVVRTFRLFDGGTARIYKNGNVDAVDGRTYVISPGFDSVDELYEWLRGPEPF